MKKLICILACFLLTGCLGTKTISDKSLITNSNENKETKQVSEKETNTNRPINSKSGISLKTGDSLVNARIREALRNFNFNNDSGSNSTSVKFDEQSMALLIANIIGETKDTKDSSTTTTLIEKSFEQKSDEYFSKKISQIPWWLYLVAAIYLLPKIIETISLLYRPFSKLTSKPNA